MPALNLPFEISEHLLGSCDTLHEASILAQTSPIFNDAWRDPFARLRICNDIIARRYSYLELVKSAVEYHKPSLGSQTPNIDGVTTFIAQLHDECKRASHALSVYEKGASNRVSQDKSLNPFDLSIMSREDFIETYMLLWSFDYVPKMEQEAFVESLLPSQASRLEEMAYWFVSLNEEQNEELQDSNAYKRSAVAVLDARNGPWLRRVVDISDDIPLPFLMRSGSS